MILEDSRSSDRLDARGHNLANELAQRTKTAGTTNSVTLPLAVQATMRHRRRLVVLVAFLAVAAGTLLLWPERSEPAAALVARKGAPWLVAESAVIDRRFGGKLIPAVYLILRGVREWDASGNPPVGTVLVYTDDEYMKTRWRECVDWGGASASVGRVHHALGSGTAVECWAVDTDGTAVKVVSGRFRYVDIAGLPGAY